MKKLVFGYVCDSARVRRTYGGTNYTLSVWKFGGGDPIRVGSVSRCNSSHKGEDSEAWGCLVDNDKAFRSVLKRRAKVAGVQVEMDGRRAYIPNWRDLETMGIVFKNLGGAIA